MEIYCPLSPRQREAWGLFNDDHTEHVLFGGGSGGGKSWLAWTWMILWCYAYPGTRYFAARNQITDIEESGLTTFFKVMETMGIGTDTWQYNQNKHFLRSNLTGSTIKLIDLKYRASDRDYNRLGSKEFTAGVVEEAQEIEPKAVDILRVRVGRHRNEQYGLKPLLVFTANPDKGWLYDDWYYPWKTGTLPRYMRFVRSLEADNPFLPESYRRSLRRIRDEATRQRLLDGEWEYANDPRQIISPEWITVAYHVAAVDGPARLGVDPAGDGYGIDDNCIAVMAGNTLEEIIKRRYDEVSDREGEDMFADLVIEVATRYGVAPEEVRVDAQGPGAGLLSVLRAKGWPCRKIYSQGKAMKRRGEIMKLRNIRSQGLYELAEKLRLGRMRIAFKDTRVKASLTSYYRSEDEKTWAAEDKRLTRRRLGRSPDDGDAIWMAALDFPKHGGRAHGRRIPRVRPEA